MYRRSCTTIIIVFCAGMLVLPVMAQDIFKVISDGDLEQAKMLVEKDLALLQAVNDDNDTPLHFAASRGDREMLDLLIRAGAHLDARNHLGYTPLHNAAARGHVETARALIAAGADVNLKTVRGRTPLFLVAMNNGNVHLAALLLDAGADVNTRENSGSTPLAYAPFRGYGDLIDLFLDRGAEVQVNEDLWFEVFHRACSLGHMRLAGLMIEKGLDLDRRNEDGRLALHSAAEGGSLAVVDLLLTLGNPINDRDYCGATPLHFAAVSGHLEIVRKLVSLGADIDCRNVLGETPLNMAGAAERMDVVDFLEREGADQNPPRFPVIQGPYLGQKPPGDAPEVFGPGLVSAYAPVHGCLTFTPDGREMYWSIVDFQKRGSTLYRMQMREGRWSRPETPPFASPYSDDVPFCSPDGRNLYLLTNRPIESGAEPTKERIWVLERQHSGWGNARPVDAAFNSMDLHWQFSVSEDGSIYFASSAGGGRGMNDIYVSRLAHGEYQPPVNLGDAINTEYADFAPYVFPDESVLVFTSMNRPEGSGLYCSSRRNGSWTKAVYLGEAIGGDALLTSRSPDGKYLFFTGRRDGRKGVFWISAEILKPVLSASPPK